MMTIKVRDQTHKRIKTLAAMAMMSMSDYLEDISKIAMTKNLKYLNAKAEKEMAK